MFDKLKFKASVIESGMTLDIVAKEIGINPSTLHRKMNGSSDFTRNEIQILKHVLKLDNEKVNQIFFA